jgi:hypothetical protein
VLDNARYRLWNTLDMAVFHCCRAREDFEYLQAIDIVPPAIRKTAHGFRPQRLGVDMYTFVVAF